MVHAFADVNSRLLEIGRISYTKPAYVHITSGHFKDMITRSGCFHNAITRAIFCVDCYAFVHIYVFQVRSITHNDCVTYTCIINSPLNICIVIGHINCICRGSSNTYERQRYKRNCKTHPQFFSLFSFHFFSYCSSTLARNRSPNHSLSQDSG